ncbi:MAG TPA: type II toxin-antitoxin system VapC family toxin [Bryobacteraceae bacterium]|jgi:predicted nucleic acid-binding protein|nr:type II toxin-antitoxin system VapC family toxin [Bryobacteraceae bacterium]
MIVLDANVLSEILRPDPSPAVTAWFRSENPEELRITTITQAEILYGIEILPDGRRKNALRESAIPLFELFTDKVLNFDEASAWAFAAIAAAHRKAGRRISEMDCQIAAIALSRKASLCTRNIKDFYRCGIPLINPWG